MSTGREGSHRPRLLRAVLRLCLLAFPEDVRGVTRQDMEDAFFDRHRILKEEYGAGSRSMLATAALLTRELVSLLRSGWMERLDAWGPPRFLLGLREDVRFGIRALLRNPGFAVSAVSMLALGIAVNTTTFSIMAGQARIAERFERPDELAFIFGVFEDWDGYGVSAPDYRELRAEATAFREMGIYQYSAGYLTGEGEPQRLTAIKTSANLFPMLGLEAHVGRLHGAGDEDPAAPAVAVLTHRLWQERFGGEESVLGETIRLNDNPHTVIGVLPAKVEFEMLWRDAGVFLPLVMNPEETDRENRSYRPIARLAEGATMEQAHAQVTAIAARLAAAHPETNEGVSARVEPFREYFFSGDDKLALGSLLAAVAAVLLIACVNLANLLLAKGTARQAEVAIRAALGASRARVVRQLLTESLLLAFAGGAVGIVLGLWGLELVMSSLHTTPFMRDETGLSPVLLAYVFAVSTAAALAFGLTPALMASRVPLGESIKEAGGGVSVSRGRKRFRNGILVAQLALTVPLVLTCAVAFRQVRALESVDFGFSADHLLAAQVDLPSYRYEDDSQQAAFFRDAVQALASMPGITSAAAGMTVPIGPGYRAMYGPVTVEGHEAEERSPDDVSSYQIVTPGFFRTLETPLRSGRFFAPTDGPTDLPVAVVNERMARHYWPGEDPVGKRLAVTPEPTSEDWITVVGVVADFGATFYGEPPRPTLFLPRAQRPIGGMLVVARSAGDPLASVPAFREAIRRIDPGVPVSRIRSGEIMMDDWLSESRVVATTLGLFGVLALGLAVIGLYGMVAYSVTQRTSELGVRMVLGADRGAIRSSVMKSFLGLCGIGLAGGLAISAVVAIVMRSQIAFLQVPYASTVTSIVAILTGVVMLASYLPARRATAIEPVRALRCE